MSDDLTIVGENAKLFGDLVVASNEQVVCVMYDDGRDAFAINHQLDRAGRIQIFFNEEEDGQKVTRTWDVDPITLTHALTRIVRESKEKKEDSFI